MITAKLTPDIPAGTDVTLEITMTFSLWKYLHKAIQETNSRAYPIGDFLEVIRCALTKMEESYSTEAEFKS